MKTRTMIRLDAALGLPLCALAFLASLPRRVWIRFLGGASRRRSRPATSALEPVQRILVIKFLGMGSILLATPLLKRLAAAYPDARITFLTLESNAELVRRLDWVDDIVVVPRGRLFQLLLAVPGLLLKLRRKRFDLALDLEFYSRLSNLVSWGSGARRRVGFFVRARWRGSLLTESVYFNSRLPYADAVLALLRPLALDTPEKPKPIAPHFDADQEATALTRLVTLGVPQEGTLIVVNVNASDLCVERRWPGDRFARLVERFGSEVSAVDRFVFIGAPSERSDVKLVLDQVAPHILPSCLDLSGRTSLMELTVLLKRSALLITNDSGPMHLAVSLDVPTISFFGPETPDLYGPQGDKHLVFYERHWCSPCLSVYNAKIAMCHGQNECMQRIELEQVIARAAVFCRERVGLAPARIASRGARNRDG
ncbi:MAG: glycosyltransferase family 9 protein [Planctomycetota bacterium]|nr:glycosyltransferase family 9 protein [Planctomycetota bacterium]